MTIRIDEMTPTAAAVDWTVVCKDEYAVSRISMGFSAAPTSAGNVTVTVRSAEGAEHDWVAQTKDPRGETQIILNPVYNLIDGDTVRIEYANPDELTVTVAAWVDAGRPRGEDLNVLQMAVSGLAEDLTAATAGVSSSGGNLSASTPIYARYYHADLGSASPGGSGAAWTDASANNLAGWLLDAPAENLIAQTDIHDDWEGVEGPVLELLFTVMSDNAEGAADDVVNFQTVVTVGRPGASIRVITIDHSATVGACAQYTIFKTSITIPPAEVEKELHKGDHLSIRISVPDTGDLTAALVNSLSVAYLTNHVGVFSSDI